MPHVSTSAGSAISEPARVGAHRSLDAAAVLAERVPLRELEEQRLGFGARLHQWRWPAGANSTGTDSSAVAEAPASGCVIARKKACEISW